MYLEWQLCGAEPGEGGDRGKLCEAQDAEGRPVLMCWVSLSKGLVGGLGRNFLENFLSITLIET